jgi:hypothetical protein
MKQTHPTRRQPIRPWRCDIVGRLIDITIIALAMVACMIITAPAANAETWLNIGGASHHFTGGKPNHYREANPGIGLQGGTDLLPHRATWVAGYYRNSYDRDTAYAGIHIRAIDVGPLSLGAVAMAASGYPHGSYIGAVTLTATADRWRVQLLGIPRVTKNHTAVVAVQFGYRLD